jgi:hypothetical protein
MKGIKKIKQKKFTSRKKKLTKNFSRQQTHFRGILMLGANEKNIKYNKPLL